jgi:hypothetical protein
MGGESAKAASTPTEAVFLSYASEDAEAARRICDALRASGLVHCGVALAVAMLPSTSITVADTPLQGKPAHVYWI